MGTHFSEIKACTKEYYNNPMRKFKDKQFEFSNKQERLKGEIFTIVRTVQECLLQK